MQRNTQTGRKTKIALISTREKQTKEEQQRHQKIEEVTVLEEPDESDTNKLTNMKTELGHVPTEGTIKRSQ